MARSGTPVVVRTTQHVPPLTPCGAVQVPILPCVRVVPTVELPAGRAPVGGGPPRAVLGAVGVDAQCGHVPTCGAGRVPGHRGNPPGRPCHATVTGTMVPSPRASRALSAALRVACLLNQIPDAVYSLPVPTTRNAGAFLA